MTVESIAQKYLIVIKGGQRLTHVLMQLLNKILTELTRHSAQVSNQGNVLDETMGLLTDFSKTDK
jgi:hypothetical protein